jgi:hypothetical protein
MSLTTIASWLRQGALLALPAMALFLMPATGLAQSARSNPLLTLGDYRQVDAAARAGDEIAGNRLAVFLVGLLDGVKASNAAFLASGVKPRICMASNSLFDAELLAESIDLLLAKEPRYFNSRPDINIGLVAMMAVQMRFPCK